MRMRLDFAMAGAVVLLLSMGCPALAQQGAKGLDCAKPDNAKRSECAKATGQSRENERTNKGGAATGADRSGGVQELNAAREKGGKKN